MYASCDPSALLPFDLQIDYFNNQIIVDLVEQPHKGIISILDEACLTVGKVTDTVCLESMNTKLAQHPHYTSRKVRISNLLNLCINTKSFFLNQHLCFIWIFEYLKPINT